MNWFMKNAVMLFLCAILFVGIRDAYCQSVELIRYDRLPDLPGEVSSYDLNVLPSTTAKYMVVADVSSDATKSFANGNIWVKGWGDDSLGKVVNTRTFVAGSDYIATPDGKASAIIPIGLEATKERYVYLFRDLSLVEVYDISAYPNAWLANISNDGKIVCRVNDESPQALFLLPGNKIDIRTFPNTFLNWDFARSRAIIRNERLLQVVTAAKTVVYSCKLPFVAVNAWPFHNGTVMARSRSIGGDDGPAWRIALDEHGKVKGESIFGEWMQFPDDIVHGSFLSPGLPQGKVTPSGISVAPRAPSVAKSAILRYTSSEIVTIERGKLITRSIDLHDGIPPWNAGVPASNAFHEYNCLDHHNRLYTLMSESRAPGKENEDSDEAVYMYQPGSQQPTVLVKSHEVAKLLGIASAWIYSMTVSPDGERLAITVTSNDDSHEKWWLVEYRIKIGPPIHC